MATRSKFGRAVREHRAALERKRKLAADRVRRWRERQAQARTALAERVEIEVVP